MFKFHIKGFAACNDSYYFDRESPIDVTVYAETQYEKF